ncbi:hypothetical protein JCM10207_000593 [Rhodosporidiobolus poonsookiae]
MADAITSVLGTVAGLTPDLTNPLNSLNLLLDAEEKDAKRIRVSRVGWWKDVRRLRGSTLGRSWKAITVVTLWATFVAVVDLVYGKDLGLTNNVTPMLSVVVGLLLVFRNGSAYARWDDGRKTFAKMLATVRNLSRTVWLNVGAPTPIKGRLASDGILKPADEQRISDRDREDKVKALRLMVAFVVATKHHIRREYGTDWADLAPILPPKFLKLARTTGFGWGAAEADHSPSSPSTVAENTNDTLSSELHRLASRRSHASNLSVAAEEGRSATLTSGGSAGAGAPPLASPASFHSTAWPGGDDERRPLLKDRRQATQMSTDSMVVLADYMAKPCLPLPLVIAHQLGQYFASCKRRNLLESIGPAGYNALVTALNQLVDAFTTCERLANVSIPVVYGVHLKQCTTLFLLTLPLVLVELMGFTMIPFVTVVAFTLIGIESIASEIEMPFGSDTSDLPLDLFCAELRNEVEHIISRLSMGDDSEWEGL